MQISKNQASPRRWSPNSLWKHWQAEPGCWVQKGSAGRRASNHLPGRSCKNLELWSRKKNWGSDGCIGLLKIPQLSKRNQNKRIKNLRRFRAGKKSKPRTVLLTCIDRCIIRNDVCPQLLVPECQPQDQVSQFIGLSMFQMVSLRTTPLVRNFSANRDVFWSMHMYEDYPKPGWESDIFHQKTGHIKTCPCRDAPQICNRPKMQFTPLEHFSDQLEATKSTNKKPIKTQTSRNKVCCADSQPPQRANPVMTSVAPQDSPRKGMLKTMRNKQNWPTWRCVEDLSTKHH